MTIVIVIEARGGTHTFECGPGEPILYAGLRHGLRLPYECATGTCGTCRGRITTGAATTQWDAAPGFARLRRDKGDVLLCQAHAAGACTIKIPADIAPLADQPLADQHGLPAWRDGEIVGLRSLTPDVAELGAMSCDVGDNGKDRDQSHYQPQYFRQDDG